ncbi:MAG: ATPase [Bacteroidetes bacterium]|nr:ATPase [Bacteroidota bacterium]
MKKLIFSSIALFAFSFMGSAQAKSDTLMVLGNCGMCKSNIETAATKAGANSAVWNKETKILVVNYDETKTTNLNIQKSIAAAGYDTPAIKATDADYLKLEKCCQYDRNPKKEN